MILGKLCFETMRLEAITKLITPLMVRGPMTFDIEGIAYDSRQVKKNFLFVALRGQHDDGTRFVDDALRRGAVAVVSELDQWPRRDIAHIHVEDARLALAEIACAFYDRPSDRIELIGITGTNGKTTTSFMCREILRAAGRHPGLIGTVRYELGERIIPASRTTPEAPDIQFMLDTMVRSGCRSAVMEVSSHALDQKRVYGTDFDVGVFTNLTRDHLDYHKTFENYRNAKKAFFDGLPKTAFAITNADDKNGMIMVQNTKATVKTYSTRSMADFRARILECHFGGMYLEIDGREVGVQFIGKFNVSNLLAVYGAAIMLGKKPEDVLVVMSTLHSVSGRLEPIQSPEGYTAIVDYAHTPDALENVLNAIHEVLEGKGGEVITVCGAGGNRDKGKRPLMAQEAVKQSDKVIITSDNPRFEEPQDIINDMLAGLNAQQMKKVISIVDRKEAIRTACMLAKKGDVILVAGKGHEDYQEIKGVKHHFDDKEVIRDIFGISQK